MHVLPLPFGLALALVSRREAERIRKPKPVHLPLHEQSARERMPSDLFYAELRRAL